jgi:hypothetical protein
MGDIQTTNGAKFYISAAAASADTDTVTEFEALTWTEIGLIEDLGNLGDVSTEVKGASIGDGRVRKAKGARDAGTMNVKCFHDPADDGQKAAILAEATNDNYGFKLELPDGPPSPGTNTIQYFRGMVMSKELNLGTNDNIMRRVINIAVNSAITEDPATSDGTAPLSIVAAAAKAKSEPAPAPAR